MSILLLGRQWWRIPDAAEVQQDNPAILLLETLGGCFEFSCLNVEYPLEVGAHLALHLAHLLQRIKTLADETPGLVRVGVVADSLGLDHECKYKNATAP
jgi:hypothetical protein